MKTFWRLPTFLIALGAAAPVIAAEPILPPPPTPQAVVKLHEYADCLATKRPKVVRALLTMDFRDDNYQKSIRDVAGPGTSCLTSGRLAFAPILVAGAMAERVFAVDFAGRPASTLLPTEWTARPIVSRNSSEYAALCIVQRQPDAVQALLATPAAGEEEKVAFRPLLAGLPDCMQPKTQLAINRPYYRAILSLALYRAVRHFSAPAQGTNG